MPRRETTFSGFESGGAAAPKPLRELALVLPIAFSLAFGVVPSPVRGDAGPPKNGSTTAPSLASSVESSVLDAERDALKWIGKQMVPNDTVSLPDPGRRRLLLSYRVPRTDPAYPYVYGRSFIYDDALGAIALTMAGQFKEAEFLLGALGRLVRSDGSMWFVYNTQNDWPGEGDHEGALIRSGALAWVGYAFTYYIAARQRDDGSFLEKDPLAAEFLRAAESIARFIVAHQVKQKADPRYGLVTGGEGSYTLAVSGAASAPVEKFDGAQVRWVSMEHNIDVYFFLRDLGRITGNRVYAETAELAGARLARLWSDADDQFFQGILENGSPDTVLPLDGASWGALFLLARGRNEEALRCLEGMETRFRTPRTGGTREAALGVSGYRPYAAKTVYDDERVNGHFFPGHPDMSWSDLDFVWGEGSLGAAAANVRAGRRSRGFEVIQSLTALREGGGFRYASSVVPFQFTDYPSVAATAWFVIAVEVLKGGAMGESFWGK